MPTSGIFSLTGDVSFGPTFGLVSNYFKSSTINPASAGFIRLSKTDAIEWRNNANSGNNVLAVNSSDILTYNGSPFSAGTVTSVALTVPAFLSVSGSPVTSSGTLAVSFSGTALPIANGGTAVTSLGNLTDVGTDGIIVGSGTGAVIHNTTISQHVADSTHNGYLSSTDWSTFNSAAGGGITSLTGDVTGTGPGATATTLATVNGNVGSFTNASITVNAKGLITAASNGAASGTVNTGTAGQLAYYATSTNAVSGSTQVSISGNSLVLSSNGSPSVNIIAPDASTVSLRLTRTASSDFIIRTTAAATLAFRDETNSLDFLTYTHPSAGLLTSSVVLAMGANKITGLANGTASTDAAAFGQIKYLQAVQATSTTATSTTSSTFTAATNQSVTITPTSASNRVKITVSTIAQANSTTTSCAITIKRGATELSGVVNGFSRVDPGNLAGGDFFPTAFSYIDSPATTSATTYQVFFRSSDNTTSCTVGRADLVSVIMAEEIV